jgi:endonuclease VIII
MPEGPEIARSAAEISAAIATQDVRLIEFAFPHLQPYCAEITGSKVLNVGARGKAMLIQFSCAKTLYSHNQLYGQWAILAPEEPANPKLQIRVAVHTASAVAVLYSASSIEVWPSAQIHKHPYIAKLGVELLATNTTVADVRRVIEAPLFQKRRLTQLLLDQTFLAGLGNYLRSDILFVARINPCAKLYELNATQRQALATAALHLSQQSYTTRGITNDLAIAKNMRDRGASFGSYRHWVFDRAGATCHVCTTTIVREDISGRAVFYCPQCQK